MSGDTSEPAGWWRRSSRPARVFAAWIVLAWCWLYVGTALGMLGVDIRRHHLEAAGITFGTGIALLAVTSLPPFATRPRGRRDIVVPAVTFAFGWMWAAWSLDLGLLSDDFGLLASARAGELLPASWPFVRPLPLLLWRGIDTLWPVVGLHALSVTVHAANAALVAALACHLFGRAAGLSGGLLFAVFPAHLEATAWASGIFDLLATFGVLLGILWWYAGRSDRARIGGVIAGLVIGCASKESAFMLPPLLTLLEVLAPAGPQRVPRWRLLLVPCSAAVILLGLRALSGPLGGDLVSLPVNRHETKLMLAAPFLRLAAPFRVDAGIPVEAWIAGLLLLTALGSLLLGAFRRREPQPEAVSALVILVAWPLIAAAPLGLAFYVGPNLEGSRYLYLPVVGLALTVGAACTVARGRAHQRAMAIAAGALLVIWMWTGAAERTYWREAAAVRDRILDAATAAARQGGCGALELRGAPDSVRGAYVFRSGLPEAMQMTLRTGTATVCAAEWTGNEIVLFPR